uniref:Uncharacterized protein n=1 Tax=Octopus bimaculoides TaxID=37653 RepID=A0A0L8IC01_OCTBM
MGVEWVVINFFYNAQKKKIKNKMYTKILHKKCSSKRNSLRQLEYLMSVINKDS